MTTGTTFPIAQETFNQRCKVFIALTIYVLNYFTETQAYISVSAISQHWI